MTGIPAIAPFAYPKQISVDNIASPVSWGIFGPENPCFSGNFQGLIGYKKPMNPVLIEKFQLNPEARRKMLLTLAFAALIPCLLWIPGIQELGYETVSREWYQALKNLLGVYFVVVGFSIFFIGWYSYHREAEGFHITLGITFLAVGGLDLLHFLTSSGMPDFLGPNTSDKTSWFWLCARLIEAIGIYAALALQKWTPKSKHPFQAFLFALLLILGVTLLAINPPMLQGNGFLRWGLLVSIFLVNVLNLLVYVRKFKEDGGEIKLFILTALLFGIYAEVCLASHLDKATVMGLVGLLYKGLSYMLLFRALVVSGIVTPYAQLETALQLYDQAHKQSQMDGLTGLFNHACFKEHLLRHFQEARRYDRPLSLMMLDLDHFKRINDTCGHPAGDEVLKAVANTVRSNIRDCDYACRYGGEELVLLLPETSEEQAAFLAERLRRQVRTLTACNGALISASFGVAQIENSDACGEDLLMRADQALYLAKQTGRDRVCAHRADQAGGILFSR